MKRVAVAFGAIVLALAVFVLAQRSSQPDASSPGVESVAPAVTEVAHLKIDGMTCSSCAFNLKAAFRQIDGVVKADVDFPSGEATVEYDPSRCSPEQLAEQAKKIGFSATLAS